jgi:hypothetical protein
MRINSALNRSRFAAGFLLATPLSRRSGLRLPCDTSREQCMIHDSEYCRRRAALARAAASRKDDHERTAMEGQLALAYASLARSRGQSVETAPVPELVA